MRHELPEGLISFASSPLGDRLQMLRLERGWNMDKVALAASISRTTLFHLERGSIRRPHASTLHKLAQVFGIPVEDLREEKLAPRSSASLSDTRAGLSGGDRETSPAPRLRARGEGLPWGLAAMDSQRREFDRATNPVVAQVAGEQPELFTGWTDEDWDELYGQFATGGALREEGVRQTVQRINHDRETLYRLRVVLQTHLGTVAAGMVDTLYKLVSVEPQPGAVEAAAIASVAVDREIDAE
ncbi:MAG: helix-turn-helix domain-containing protein [Planctomycetales bacterium]